ncbi:MAG: hypothetical protein M5R36_12835 [Deltaproteobacteria bacterium]|nr:hypothetical protein [Deltaproteobacteria bacterium]
MTPRLWAWPIVMLFLAAATVYAAEGEEDDLAAELNAAITRDEGPGAQIAGAFQDVSGLDLSLIADVGWAAFTTGDRYRMGGHSFRENGPFVQNIELAASANVDPYFRFDLNHSFTHGHIEEGVISTTSLPWVKFRLGQFKTDLGRVNPTHLHTWNFVDQPLAIEWLFGGEGMALPGAEFSLLFPLPWYAEFVFASQKGQVVSMDAATVLQADDLIYSSRLKQFVEISDALGLFFSANGAQGPKRDRTRGKFLRICTAATCS